MRSILLALSIAAAPALGGTTVTVTVAPEKAQPKVTQDATAIYLSRCVVCHGPTGAGDGVAALGMKPRPRAFADKAWQRSVKDDHIFTAILKGGAAVKKSPLMPANEDLKPEVVHALVQLIRQQPAARVRAELKPEAGKTVTFSGLMIVGGTFTLRGAPEGKATLSGFVDVDGDGARDDDEKTFTQELVLSGPSAAVTVRPSPPAPPAPKPAPQPATPQPEPTPGSTAEPKTP
jgi:mono/diheme cytochrome c family protein